MQAPSPSTVGVVLSGGKSTRMGTDKGSLVVGGMSMLDRARIAFRDAGITEVLVAGTVELPDLGSEISTHEPQGPMAGIVSAWVHLQKDAVPDTVVVLSCDLPAIPAAVIRELLATAEGHAHGAVAHDGERPQPLIAAYHAVAMDEFQRAFHAGERSVRRCFTDWDLGVCTFDRALLVDADTPGDLIGFDVRWPTS